MPKSSTRELRKADRLNNQPGPYYLDSAVSVEAAQDAIGAMVGTSLVYVDATPALVRAALTGDVTSSQDSNTTSISNLARSKLANGTANTFVTNDSGGVMASTSVTASRAVVTDVNGLPSPSATTSTELSYVNGVTSGIQAQINAITAAGTGVHVGQATIDFGTTSYVDTVTTTVSDPTVGATSKFSLTLHTNGTDESDEMEMEVIDLHVTNIIAATSFDIVAVNCPSTGGACGTYLVDYMHN